MTIEEKSQMEVLTLFSLEENVKGRFIGHAFESAAIFNPWGAFDYLKSMGCFRIEKDIHLLNPESAGISDGHRYDSVYSINKVGTSYLKKLLDLSIQEEQQAKLVKSGISANKASKRNLIATIIFSGGILILTYNQYEIQKTTNTREENKELRAKEKEFADSIKNQQSQKTFQYFLDSALRILKNADTLKVVQVESH